MKTNQTKFLGNPVAADVNRLHPPSNQSGLTSAATVAKGDQTKPDRHSMLDVRRWMFNVLPSSQAIFVFLMPLLLLFPFTLPAPPAAHLTYTTNNGTITITGYTYGVGMDSLGSIPGTIDGLPVTGIGDNAFEHSSLTSVTIPNSVTTIGNSAFSDCRSLWEITVDVSNPVYSSVDGVLFNKSRTMLIQCPGEKAGSYTIPNSVTVIVGWA